MANVVWQDKNQFGHRVRVVRTEAGTYRVEAWLAGGAGFDWNDGEYRTVDKATRKAEGILRGLDARRADEQD